MQHNATPPAAQVLLLLAQRQGELQCLPRQSAPRLRKVCRLLQALLKCCLSTQQCQLLAPARLLQGAWQPSRCASCWRPHTGSAGCRALAHSSRSSWTVQVRCRMPLRMLCQALGDSHRQPSLHGVSITWVDDCITLDQMLLICSCAVCRR
jgi:hypothetical protein